MPGERDEAGQPGRQSRRAGTASPSGRPRTGHEPDYRFTLANERTLLAYLRTALALDAAALAVVQFLPDVSSSGARRAVAALLALTGLLAAVGGFRRWAANQRAMRTDSPLPAARLVLVLGLAVAALSFIGLVLAVFG